MENTVRCLKILSALAEDCSTDMLERCNVAAVISCMCDPQSPVELNAHSGGLSHPLSLRQPSRGCAQLFISCANLLCLSYVP